MASARLDTATTEVIAYTEKEQFVKLVYDTWTPRPHFIVVQCEPKRDATTEEFKATFEIVGRFLHKKPQFDTEAVLSFHRGKWYQKHTNYWHAHLCVPKQPYLEQARTAIQKRSIHSNREWKNARTIDEGMNNWYKRKIQDYNKYKNLCIQKGIPNQTLVGKIPLSTFNSNPNMFELVWTTPAPRIGIVARSPGNTTLVFLYDFMSEVHTSINNGLSLQDRSFSNFGCHLCLYVRSQSGTTVTCREGQILSENDQSNINSNIVGYIQMEESQYVQWLPLQLRQKWFAAFHQTEYFVHT